MKRKKKQDSIRICGIVEDRLVIELHACGDEYHDMCDSTDCHWQPDAFETLYLDRKEVNDLRTALNVAWKKLNRKTK